MAVKIYHGDILFTPAADRMEIHENSYIIVEDGVVSQICEKIPETYNGVEVVDYGDKLIIPAFSDLHVHGAQYVQRGNLIPATRFHVGILIAIVCVIVVWFFLEKTTMGYELKAVGLNKRGSACNGISVMKNIVLSAFLSGGLAAAAGGIEVLAIQKKLLEGISSNCGYTAVLVALVAFNNPLGVLFVAIFYAAMQVGAGSMQRQLGVPSAIVNILIGLVVVLILGRELFHFKKKQSKVKKGGNA